MKSNTSQNIKPVNQKRSCSYQKSTNTLDHCHKANLDLFEQKRETLVLKKGELAKYQEQLKEILEKPNNMKTDEEFIQMVTLNDEIKLKQKEIDRIENNSSELVYFTNTSHILYNYYNLVENNNDNKKSIEKQIISLNKKSILDYFHKNESTTTSLEAETIQENHTSNDGFDEGDNLQDENENDFNRASLLDKYLSLTDSNYINDNINNILAANCEHCSSTSKTFLHNDSIAYCNDCFAVYHLLTDNEKPSYKDPPKEISYFSYKRINHYQEWLNQIQGKETTDIPEEVFDQIMLELKKQRIYNTKELTSKKVKEILKKLKINKYYEHIPYILNRITGIPNPNLTPELEEKLRNMFKEIQVPFLKHSPLIRKNFLSYSYVIHKFIQILDKPEYLKHFPLLKSREKLHQQEEIWKKICIDLNWKFIRSI
tara:strand:+ start:557 stop:1840 length:1284 start_codon:yes stop_codon:yes gene_type:complete